jgi:hypothetical protein
MDWLELQDKVGRLRRRYFCEREIPQSKIDSAKSKDIGESAKSIDAAIRIISRATRKDEIEEIGLTEDEKDILAIRLDWAFQIAIREGANDRRPYGQTMTEDEFEELLINQWQKVGREKYETQQHRIDRIFPNQRKPKPPDDKKSKKDGDESKQPSESPLNRGGNKKKGRF